ncbi:hypothetical protein QR680_000392 [Steinernema hermaphroditum]|uniref:Uncharacterized protein n=1 Tax=Steinernema hermaphroditum TaxID=289476 RepID=A0AA39GUL2_9BILA|nr:hypothetical protein QR680_000392 [Steinernema hermaphroditum]
MRSLSVIVLVCVAFLTLCAAEVAVASEKHDTSHGPLNRARRYGGWGGWGGGMGMMPMWGVQSSNSYSASQSVSMSNSYSAFGIGRR